MCTGYAHMRPGPLPTTSPKQQKLFAKLFGKSELPPDEHVPRMVLEFLGKTNVSGLPIPSQIKTISLAIHDLGNVGTGIPSEFFASDAVIIKTASAHYYAAAAFHNGKLLTVRQLSPVDLVKDYTFAREMAAYMLLNDLLGGDATVPRAGCVIAFKDQLAGVPGVQYELKTAMLTPPKPDPNSEDTARKAYQTFAAGKEPAGNKITRDTVARLGTTPNIEFVYRDRDTTLGIGPEIDVIRLSSGNLRTYAMLTTGRQQAVFMSPALCRVGNRQCSGYYVWP